MAEIAKGQTEGPLKPWRDLAKIVNFGSAGGLQKPGIMKNARLKGLPVTEEDVDRVMAGYTRLNPASKKHLAKETPSAEVAVAKAFDLPGPKQGVELFRILNGDSSLTESQQEVYWCQLEKMLEDVLPQAPRQMASLMELVRNREPSPALRKALVSLRFHYSSLSPSGRVYGNTTWTSARNCSFQAVAADGALEAGWMVWRSGLDLVLIIHDELVVRAPAGPSAEGVLASVSDAMQKGMARFIGGATVPVTGFIRRSLSPIDEVSPEELNPKEEPPVEDELPPQDYFWSPPQEEEEESHPEGITTDAEGNVLTFTAAEPKPRKRRGRRPKPVLLEPDDDDVPF